MQDFKMYLDFVLTMENRSSPEAMAVRGSLRRHRVIAVVPVPCPLCPWLFFRISCFSTSGL